MLRRLALVGVLLALPLALWAAGSVSSTATDVGAGLTRYDLVWTSTAGGAVSGNTLTLQTGWIRQAEFKPASGGTQPTDLYDAVLNDVALVDFMNGAGANLSNATGKLITFSPPIYYDGTSALDLVISNAGAAKSGTLTLWVGQ